MRDNGSKGCKRSGLVLATLVISMSAYSDDKDAAVNAEASVAAVPKVVAEDCFTSAGSQVLTLSGGYVSTDYEDASTDPEGWRIQGTYETNPGGGPLLHGMSIGYLETEAERTGTQTVSYKVKTIPFYYSPKIVLGKKMFRIFAKGALGCHFSDYSRRGSLGSSSSDEFGFYGGAGFGGMIVVKQKFFLNAEYEWAYMTNSYFQDGAVQSALVGIGINL